MQSRINRKTIEHLQERLFLKIYITLFLTFAVGIILSVLTFTAELGWWTANKNIHEIIVIAEPE